MDLFDLDQLKGARVVVIGGGRAGLAAVELLVQRGAAPVVVDDSPTGEVRARVAARGLDRVEVVGGGITEEGLAGAQLLVLSPGVPRAHPAVSGALEAGAEVVNEVELGVAALERPCVLAITGTNGKSTTATLAGSIAQRFEESAFVGGNLGLPLCEAVAGGARPRLVVLELSSYQLETIQRLPVRAAVVTNLSPDHLDRYPSVEAYYDAKARLFGLVEAEGGSALNRADATSQAHLVDRAAGHRLDFDVLEGTEGVALVDGRWAEVRVGGSVERVDLKSDWLLGRHNLQNAMAAIAGAALCGVPPAAWRAGVAAYRGIAHRMERVAEREGVLYVNDSKATNVDAAVKAVESFEGGVHLIVGGVGKGSSYAPLVDAARGRVARVYTIGEEGPALAAALAGVAPVEEAGTLQAAMSAVRRASGVGDVVLLAPACASFDQFANFGARGEAFRALAGTGETEKGTRT